MGRCLVACLALLLGGCDLVFGPGPGPGGVLDAPVGGGDDAPIQGIDARLIDANFPDASIDGDVTLDSDGDTIDDSIDNCPQTGNPDQRDHDGDAVGDPCDPCPHLDGATGADIDTDGDVIGDGCDPRPNIPGDVRVAWYGFYDSAEIVSWTQTPAGSWSVTGGVLRLTGTPPLAEIEWPFIEDNVFATIGVLGTDQPPGADVPHLVGISIGRAGTQRHDCAASKTTGQPAALRYHGVDTGNFPTDEQVDWVGGEVLGADLRVTALVHDTQAKCAVTTQPGGAPSALLDVTAPISAHQGTLAISTVLLAVDVDYLFVVRRGN